MPLPDIDLNAIRKHRGSQADAFEELCCQLANDEIIADRVRFDRKGRGGDAGVECFVTLADQTEIGWQVKFYSDFDSMIGSLDKSLDKALQKHPAMTRFIACFPFDLSDSRRDDVTTALAKWNAWHDKRVKAAASSGRTITIDRWDAHEIKLRLTDSNARSAGRIAFWFDEEMLSAEWLNKAFRRIVDSLGERYSPESHIDLPVRQTILATVRDPSVFDALSALAERIESRIEKAPAGGNGGTLAAAAAAAQELTRVASERPEPFPFSDLASMVDSAADHALAWHDDLQRGSTTEGQPDPEVVAVSNLVAALRGTGRVLWADWCRHLDTRALLVLGDAGTGKSHLLADACAHQLEDDRPTIMVLGGKLPDAEPWSEILKDLDLPRHLQVKQFLGALNAAGEAAGVRTLVAIDALNEKNGQLIWPERLAGLLSDLREFPWITVVLSCRTTYEDLVIPSSLDASKLPRIVHEGFDDHDVVRYLAKRGISVPETPRQLEELQNPLFLRLACDALSNEGEVLMPESLAGISDALRLFTSAVIRRVETSLNVAPRRAIVRQAIDALAREMSDVGQGQISFRRADELMRSIHDGTEIARDLLFQLENEGLLVAEHDSFSMAGAEQIVRFTFERIGDHAIASSLLDRSAQGRQPAALCEPGSPLHQALSDPNSRIVPGVLEALAVQLPERFGLELPDLAGLPHSPWPGKSFRASLLTRRAAAFGSRTWELVEQEGDHHLRFETLIALATEVDHPLNVRFLDAELRALRMPERDAAWSAHLATSERADHLVHWAWSADQSRITDARAELAAVQLAWFLTATRRPLRDRATKALVALLADRPELAIKLWVAFRDLDDGYVTERTVAALYGAAMQGRWPAATLSAVAMRIHEDLFADRSPPANELLRDHALGLVGYALVHGAPTEAIDPANLKPPFVSPWPIEHVPDEKVETYTRTFGAAGRWQDEIVSSCQDGDFGRYVLDSAVDDWSPAPIGTSPLPTALELRATWYEAFTATASQEMRDAHDSLVETLARENPNETFVHGEARDRIRAAKAAFRAAVGSDAFEEWREKAEHWRAEGMYQSYASRGPAEISLAWARRWVAMRAHELGWSEDLHGDFDRQVRGDRNNHSLERIGKKYQWLALYELVARMSDNLARISDRNNDRRRLRNLDPSLLVDRTADDGWRQFDNNVFWTGTPPGLPARTPADAIAWLHSGEDILDGIDNVSVTSPDDGREWLVLAGFESWRAPASKFRTEAWRRIGCVVVRSADRDRALAIMARTHLTADHDLPSAEGAGYRVHLGEFPWRTLTEDHDDWIPDWRPYGSNHAPRTKVAARPTVAEYVAEANAYDGSISENINLHLPARWLMEALDLRLTDGRSILYQDASRIVRFWDPSVSEAGRSAALVDRRAFLDLLKRDDLVAIWAVAGEKNAYGQEHSDGFGGRFTFTRLFDSDGNEIRASSRLDSFDEPTATQRAEFLGEAPSDDDELSNEHL